jgi:methylated-DNA-[protein]-cysteine S-methyltransferase
MAVTCASFDTPIGRHWVVVSPVGLAAVVRSELPPVEAPIDEVAGAHAIDELVGYFAGRARGFTLRLDVRAASPFDRAIWSAAREIPYGTTASYGELAILAGHPGAARAAGGSMARCPLTPVVPCHRVIRADGSIGGWGGEEWVKRWLLDLEQPGFAGRRARPPRS